MDPDTFLLADDVPQPLPIDGTAWPDPPYEIPYDYELASPPPYVAPMSTRDPTLESKRHWAIALGTLLAVCCVYFFFALFVMLRNNQASAAAPIQISQPTITGVPLYQTTPTSGVSTGHATITPTTTSHRAPTPGPKRTPTPGSMPTPIPTRIPPH